MELNALDHEKRSLLNEYSVIANQSQNEERLVAVLASGLSVSRNRFAPASSGVSTPGMMRQ